MSSLPFEALESLRQSQAHLSHSLSTLLGSLQQGPLPPTENLLTTLSLLLSHLHSLTTTLQNPRFSQELKSTAVYPQTTFPVRQYETILTSLLRRKLLPQDEEWERQGREMAQKIDHLDPEREDAFIEWCQMRFMEIIEGREYSRGTKTKEEREAKEINGEGDEIDEVDEHDEGGNESGVALGAALKFLAQGIEPTKPPQGSPPKPIR